MLKRAATRIASFLWSLASGLARWAAGAGMLASRRLPVRTVSVGNLQVGGAGKTPLVALIAREAEARGITACILCRGYGGEWEGPGGVIAPGEPQGDAALWGDEPTLLHDLAPRAWIGVGADRGRAFDRVAERAAAAGASLGLVILDDGFQHHALRRDVDVLALTSARPGSVLFRDFPSALRGAQLAVWTKGDQRPQALGVPLARVRFKLPEGPETRPIWLVTGLADGRGARSEIEASGYRVARHLVFPDHARYSDEMIRGLMEQAQAAGASVAVTGKDWVKWRGHFGPQAGARPPVKVLEPELVFEEGRELWEKVLWAD